MKRELVEEKILAQRREAANRIWIKWPKDCFAARDNYCSKCIFRAKPTTGLACQHGLAPITSAQLPCPYYRLS